MPTEPSEGNLYVARIGQIGLSIHIFIYFMCNTDNLLTRDVSFSVLLYSSLKIDDTVM